MKPIDIDSDIKNADWTKRTWDLPKYGSVEFNEFLEFSGMTLDSFKKLPVYKWAVESGLIKREVDISVVIDQNGKKLK